MNKHQEDIEALLANLPHGAVTHKAPDLSAVIWRRHQQRNRRRWAVMAAGLGVVGLLSWQSLPQDNGGRLAAHNRALEQQLAQVSQVRLAGGQSAMMLAWREQLALLDARLMQDGSADPAHPLWADRAQLMTQMIDFYRQPVAVVEI